MNEHDDDLESEVSDDGALETDKYPDAEDELEDVENDEAAEEDEDAGFDDDQAEL